MSNDQPINRASPDPRFAIAMGVAVVSGLFAVFVGAMLLGDYRSRTAVDPVDNQTVALLKAAIEAQPKAESERIAAAVEAIESQPGLDAESIAVLKNAVGSLPKEELIERLREYDSNARNAYFRQRNFTAMGSWLMLGALAICLAAARSATVLRRKLPTPGVQASPVDAETKWTYVGR